MAVKLKLINARVRIRNNESKQMTEVKSVHTEALLSLHPHLH